MTILLAYIFYFIAASASPLQRRWLAVNREGGGQIDFAFRVNLVVVSLSLLLPLFFPFYISGEATKLILLTLLCGIFGAGFWVSSFVAQKHVEAGISTLVSNVYTPITIVLATIFLGESLKGPQILGTTLLLFSIILISKKHHLGKFRFDKYFLLTLVSGAMLGILLTAERTLQKTTGFSAGTMLSWLAQCGVLGFIVFFGRSRHSYKTRDTLTTGALRFLQNLSWIVLLAVIGNLSVVSAITTFKVVIMFIAAAVLLKEREDLPRKIFGSFIAVVGLLLMK